MEAEQTEPLDLRIRKTIRNWYILEGLAVPASEPVSVEMAEEGPDFELPDLDVAVPPNCDVSYYIRKK